MSPTDFFKSLGAPLHNTQWSWGAVRLADGVVFLRVWQDEERRIDRKSLMRLTHRAAYEGREENHGFRERLAHVELVRSGAPCYLVMSVAEDPKASPRRIKTFNDRKVYPAGALIEVDGDAWVELGKPVDAKDVRRLRIPE